MFLLVFICSTVFISCEKDNSPDILIRISNKSPFQFENVVVNTYNQPKNFGVIKPGEYSAYMKFDIAYRYAYIKLTAQNAEFIIQPIDFVGETPLKPGKYTYSLSVSDFSNGRLNFDFKED